MLRIEQYATVEYAAVHERNLCVKGYEMNHNPDDVIPVATGTLIAMTSLAEALKNEGIVGRVVGEDLTGGLGSTLPGTVELWVSAADADRASQILAGTEEHHK